MTHDARQRLSSACVVIDVAACRIASEVSRVASAPNLVVILEALARLDAARREGFKGLLSED